MTESHHSPSSTHGRRYRKVTGVAFVLLMVLYALVGPGGSAPEASSSSHTPDADTTAAIESRTPVRQARRSVPAIRSDALTRASDAPDAGAQAEHALSDDHRLVLLQAGRAGEGLAPRPNYEEVASVRWGNETEDANWSAQVERDLLTSFSHLTSEAQMVDVACRETLCRVQLSFHDAEDAERYASSVGTDNVMTRATVVDSQPWRFIEAYLDRPTAARR